MKRVIGCTTAALALAMCSSAINAAEVKVPQAKQVEQAKFLFQPKRDLTVLVFMSAKNDLERFAMADLNELESVGSTDKVNFVVEIGRARFYTDGNPNSYDTVLAEDDDKSDGDWNGTRRYYVTKDTDTKHVTSRLVANLGKTDMGSAASIAEFLAWGKKNYPAKKYMLVLWDHGSGWKDSGPYEANTTPPARGYGHDFEKGTVINNTELPGIFRNSGGVDVLAFDACLMQSIEVAVSLRKYAKVIVASEELEPGDGYNYTLLAESLTANPDAKAEVLGSMAVEAFAKHYSETDNAATQSAVRTDKVVDVAKKAQIFMDRLVTLSADPKKLPGIKKGITESLRFGGARTGAALASKTQGDLLQFARSVSFGARDQDLLKKYLDLQDAVSAAVIESTGTGNLPVFKVNVASATVGVEYVEIGKVVKGIAVRIPPVFGSPSNVGTTKYEQYEFESRTGWGRNLVKIMSRISAAEDAQDEASNASGKAPEPGSVLGMRFAIQKLIRR